MLNLYMRVFESSPPHSAAPGLPVFPLDQPVAEEALNASIAQVNLLSRGPNIYGITRSIIKKVSEDLLLLQYYCIHICLG